MLVALDPISSKQSKGNKATSQPQPKPSPNSSIMPQLIQTMLYAITSATCTYMSKATLPTSRKHLLTVALVVFSSSVHVLLTPPKCQRPTPSHHPKNWAIHIINSIMQNAMASAMEAELGALFHNACDDIPLCTTLIEMVHEQSSTSIQTDNACHKHII
jgi:hypothetical protein